MHATFKADLYILASTLAATSGWIFSLKALEGLPPLLFIGVRFVIAAGLVAAVAAAWDPRPGRSAFAGAGLTGALLGLAMAFWILGLQHSDNIGVGAFICSLGNIAAPLAGRLLKGWQLPTATKRALPLATIGMAFLFLNGGSFAVSAADAFFLASALASALYFVWTTEQAGRLPVLTLTALQLAVAGLVSLALSLAAEPWPTALPGAATLGWLAASVLIGTSLRFFLQVSGQGAAPLSHVALMMCLEPLWTTLVAAIWLATTFSLMQGLGCGLILVALVVNGRQAD
jgi:drug/metabolite transporter (DMT)-like permease